MISPYARRAMAERADRGRAEHGNKWDPASLEGVCSCIQEAYASGLRVRVTTTWTNGEEFTRTGVVSTTTGWRPVFLLMHRRGSLGSWDTIEGFARSGSHVVAVWRGRRYEDGTVYGTGHTISERDCATITR